MGVGSSSIPISAINNMSSFSSENYYESGFDYHSYGKATPEEKEKFMLGLNNF